MMSQGPPQAYFIVQGGPHHGKRVAVRLPLCAVGRDPRCHVRPPDPSVSPVHATIHLHEGRFYVKDQRSQSGTFVNERRVLGLAPLKTGDVIQLGNLRLQFWGKPPAAPRPQAAAPVIPPRKPLQVSPPPTWEPYEPAYLDIPAGGKDDQPAPKRRRQTGTNVVGYLYALLLIGLLILVGGAALGGITNTGSAAPPPDFDPNNAAPAMVLYFHAEW